MKEQRFISDLAVSDLPNLVSSVYYMEICTRQGGYLAPEMFWGPEFEGARSPLSPSSVDPFG